MPAILDLAPGPLTRVLGYTVFVNTVTDMAPTVLQAGVSVSTPIDDIAGQQLDSTFILDQSQLG
jgi:hypothetical protein